MMRRLFLALALLCLAACSRIMGTDRLGGGGGEEAAKEAAEQARTYGDGAAGLEALFTDVLKAAKKDDRARVHDLFATLLLGPDDLQALLGEEGRRLAPRYETLMGAMINRGAIELVGQVYEHKYDTVDVFAAEGEQASPADQALARALKQPVKLYSVRLRKASDKLGLRYDGFLFRDGRWRTLGQLGKHLAALPAPDAGK